MFDVKKMGEIIKELRGERSQDECAKALGISRGALSFYENGDRKPDADVIYKMSEYFGVPSDYILGLSTVSSYDTDLQTVCSYTGLSEKVIELLRLSFFMPTDNPYFDRLRQDIDKAGGDLKRDYAKIREITNEVMATEYFWDILYTFRSISEKCEKLQELTPGDILGDRYIEEANNGDVSAETKAMIDEHNNLYDGISLDRYHISQSIEELCDLYDVRDEVRQTTAIRKSLDRIFEYRAYQNKSKREETTAKINDILKTIKETEKALEDENGGTI